MYVRPSARWSGGATGRGMGVARKLLECVEDEARRLGLEMLVLETGVRQRAAVRLYEREGWRRRDVYAEYVGAGVEDGGVSVCFEKGL